MSRPTDPFRAEHVHLLTHIERLRTLAREVPELAPDVRRHRIDHALEFLNGTLVPHAEAEERVLYPAWAKLLGADEAAAPMVHDHRAIVERIRLLEAVDVEDDASVQELLYGLHALIIVHFHKEEDLQLPLLDQQDPAYVEELLERMHVDVHAAH